MERLIQFKRWDYLVTLSRNGRRDRSDTWARTMRERLPRIWVPLDIGLPDITLDLQEVFDRNYDDGAYARRVDYALGPSISLKRADAEWADEILRASGLRP